MLQCAMHNSSKVLLPLDTDSEAKALEWAGLLAGEVAGFKVGLELVNAVGWGIFDALQAQAGADVKVFYDCKLHDIPSTVAGAARAIARRGVWMMNVHASGGRAMMQAAVRASAQGAEGAGVARPLVIAVTVLTSMGAETLRSELRVMAPVAEYVTHLARLAQDSGCDGVVASPLEIARIRAACGPEFLIVTPGVRPAGAEAGDQKRVMTPGEALHEGADYLVVGRPITGADDPVAAARAVNGET